MAGEKEREDALGVEPRQKPLPSAEELTPGEQTIMGDGQLGGEALERGPEASNPEGSADAPIRPIGEGEDEG